MADRDLSVNVNVGGKDDLSPALERQKKLLDDLAAAEANLAQLRKDYGAVGADLVLQGLREQLAAERQITQEKQKQTTIGGSGGRPPPGSPGGPPGPGSPPQLVGMDPERQRLKDEVAERAAEARNRATPLLPRGLQTPAGYTPAPLPLGQLSETRQQARAEVEIRKELAQQLHEAKDKEIRERAYFKVTGKQMPGAEKPEEGAGSYMAGVAARFALGAGAVSLTQQAIALRHPTSYGNETLGRVGQVGGMMSTIGAAIPGPIGAAVSALGALGQAAGILGEEFRGARASLAEMVTTMREGQGLVRSVRQGGAPTAEDVRAAFAGTSMAYHLTRPGGTTAESVAELRFFTERAESQAAALGTQDWSSRRGLLEDQLFRTRNMARAGVSSDALGRAQANLTAWGVGESERPDELRLLGSVSTARNMTDQQIRQLAAVMTTGRVERYQMQAEMGRNILQSGVMPNMRPGAPQLADLPNLFRSQQRDFLDVHDQVQQELVRDQREERRFQAQYALWERILRQLEASTFTPPALPPLALP